MNRSNSIDYGEPMATENTVNTSQSPSFPYKITSKNPQSHSFSTCSTEPPHPPMKVKVRIQSVRTKKK